MLTHVCIQGSLNTLFAFLSSASRNMYLDNKEDEAISRKLEMEMTQTSAHRASLPGNVASEPGTRNLNELQLLKEFHAMVVVQGEPPTPHQNRAIGQDCCVALGKDFSPLTMQGR